MTLDSAPRERQGSAAAGGELAVPQRLTPDAVLAELPPGARQILCEGGPPLGALEAADAVDELCLTLSPLLVAGDAGRIAHGAPGSPARRASWWARCWRTTRCSCATAVPPSRGPRPGRPARSRDLSQRARSPSHPRSGRLTSSRTDVWQEGTPARRRTTGVTLLLFVVAALLAGCTVGPLAAATRCRARREHAAAPVRGTPAPAPRRCRSRTPRAAAWSSATVPAVVARWPCPPLPTGRCRRLHPAHRRGRPRSTRPGPHSDRAGPGRAADGPDRPPLLVIGDSNTRPSAPVALALAGKALLALLQR